MISDLLIKPSKRTAYLVHGIVTAFGKTGIRSPGLSSIVKLFWDKTDVNLEVLSNTD